MAINNSKKHVERANFAGNKLTYMKVCSLHSEIIGRKEYLILLAIFFSSNYISFIRNIILNSLGSKYLKSFILLSAFDSLFQSEFSTECDLVPPFSIYSNLSFLERHSVAS